MIFNSFDKFIDKNDLLEISKILKHEKKEGKVILPSFDKVFRAFNIDINNLKVIILGSDPYPQKDVATGLAFANEGDIHSPSLKTLLNAVIPHNEEKTVLLDPTLESWAKQGVMLLNTALTVEHQKPNSHILLWKPFIQKFIYRLSREYPYLIWVLLGTNAHNLERYIYVNSTILKEKHPSYYSRINMDMPHDIFNKLVKEVKYKFNFNLKLYETIE